MFNLDNDDDLYFFDTYINSCEYENSISLPMMDSVDESMRYIDGESGCSEEMNFCTSILTQSQFELILQTLAPYQFLLTPLECEILSRKDYPTQCHRCSGGQSRMCIQVLCDKCQKESKRPKKKQRIM